jgi:hypothetical protein
MAFLRRLIVVALAVKVAVGCAAPKAQHLQQLDANEMSEANAFYKARSQQSRLFTETARVALVAEPCVALCNVAYPVHFTRQRLSPENGANDNCDEIVPWTDTTAALVLRLVLIGIMWTLIALSQR